MRARSASALAVLLLLAAVGMASAEAGVASTFYVIGMAHSIVGGSAWEPTSWRSVQRAAWVALAWRRR